MFVCRVCLENSGDLISLKSDKVEPLLILHMLKEFTINGTDHKLPNYICGTCAKNLDIAFKFKRKFENSMIKLTSDLRVRSSIVESTNADRQDSESYTIIDSESDSEFNALDESNVQSKSQEDTKESASHISEPQIIISILYQLCPWTPESKSEDSNDISMVTESCNTNDNQIDSTNDDIPYRHNSIENDEILEEPHESKVQTCLLTNSNEDHEEQSRSNIEFYECFECKKGFPKFSALKRHTRTHLREVKPNMFFECGYCTDAFATLPKLKQHLNTAHKHEAKTYPQRFQLSFHQLKHSDSELLYCTPCGELFYERRMLKSNSNSKSNSNCKVGV